MPVTQIDGKCSDSIAIQSTLPSGRLLRLLLIGSISLDTLDDQRPLAVELVRVPLMALFLTVL